MRRAVTVLLLLLLGGLAATAFWWWRELPPEIAVVEPVRGPAVEAVYATGTVEPRRWAEIASTETGRIVAYPVEEGETVEEGDLLLRLDDVEPKAVVAELAARVEFLEADVARYRELLRSNNVSRQLFERTLSELEQARAALAAARAHLADLTIRAPLSGQVLRKDREVGEVVQPGDALVWIGSRRPYWITAQVDEEDIPRVELGQRALISADAFPRRVFEGEVAEITPKGDPVNKQYRVRILLPEDSPLLVGMTTEINVIVRQNENAQLLPDTAVVDGAVFLLEAGRARRVEVDTGAWGEGKVEILSELASDARVIADPPPGLEDGEAVRVAEAVP